MLNELRELESKSKIDELEGVHGSGLIQIVGVEDGLGLLGGGAVDVQVGQQGSGLLEGQVSLLLSIGRSEQVEGEADEQEGGNEGVVVESSSVGGISHSLESLLRGRIRMIIQKKYCRKIAVFNLLAMIVLKKSQKKAMTKSANRARTLTVLASKLA